MLANKVRGREPHDCQGKTAPEERTASTKALRGDVSAGWRSSRVATWPQVGPEGGAVGQVLGRAAEAMGEGGLYSECDGKSLMVAFVREVCGEEVG